MKTLIKTNHHEIHVVDDPESLRGVLGFGVNNGSPAVVVLCDENTHQLCYPVLEPFLPSKHRLIVTGAGERHKTMFTCETVWSQLAKAHADRSTLLINLGGGTVTDIGGFCAASYMRGIPFLNLPTSLLGMVDASSGGKNGVDFREIKNLIGTFAFPEKVIVFLPFLRTLPEQEWCNGTGEIIKHGLLQGGDLWTEIKNLFKNHLHPTDDTFRSRIVELIQPAIKVKAAIVDADPFEKNERMFLNFGHTIGHALESWSIQNSDTVLPHGEAVMAGMICELHLAKQLSVVQEDIFPEMVSIIKNAHHFHPIRNNAIGDILQFMKHDKKRNQQGFRIAVVSAPGNPLLVEGITDEHIVNALHFYNSSFS